MICLLACCRWLSGYGDSTSMLQPQTPMLRYDTSQNQYFPCAPIPSRRKGHKLLSGPRGSMYAIGGYVYTEGDVAEDTVFTTHSFSKRACLDVLEYQVGMNRWSKVGHRTSQFSSGIKPSQCCFYQDQRIIVLKGECGVMSFSLDTYECVQVQLEANNVIQAVLEGKNFCSMQYRHFAILTSFRSSESSEIQPLLIIDLKKLIAAIDKSIESEDDQLEDGVEEPTESNEQPSGAENSSEENQPLKKVNADDIIVVRHPDTPLVASGIMGLCECVDQVIAFVRTPTAEAFLYSCNADSLVFAPPSERITWRRMFKCRARTNVNEVCIRNPRRVLMRTLRTSGDRQEVTLENVRH